GPTALNERFGGTVPRQGSLVENDVVPAKAQQEALVTLAEARLRGDDLPSSVQALLRREAPPMPLRLEDESELQATIRVTSAMDGGCLVIQGPPGTGKTYTASHAIAALLAAGKRVGITSNSHKAAGNLL